MSWLVDTDLFSERTKKQPDPRVLEWLQENASAIYTSSHVIGEMQVGISLLPEGARKRALQLWLNRLLEAMAGRILNASHRFDELRAAVG
jgi:predicted nucleic acid-binding protein